MEASERGHAPARSALCDGAHSGGGGAKVAHGRSLRGGAQGRLSARAQKGLTGRAALDWALSNSRARSGPAHAHAQRMHDPQRVRARVRGCALSSETVCTAHHRRSVAH